MSTLSIVKMDEEAALASFPPEGMPRPEYPQPQFQRDDWLNLNGPWGFEFDDENIGLTSDWATGKDHFRRRIVVPFCFESPGSGIGATFGEATKDNTGNRSFHPYVWYRRTFEIPAHWRDRRVLLHFGAIDYRSMVWVNGELAGEHEGGHTPFRIDITGLLESRGNTLTVRVEDPPSDRYIPRGKQHWEDNSTSIFYTRTTGIWQTVWLEAVGDSYLEKVRIRTDVNGTVTFDAKIARPSPDLQLVAIIEEDGRTLASSMGEANEAQATVAARLHEPKLWGPDTPQLYDVTFELRRDDAVLDRVRSYFGFRTVSTQNGKVLLNGTPIYLKLVLDQGYWPDTLLTPPSDEAIQYDIRMTKQMGFNGARKHQKIEDPRYLYWADKMGLLVSAEMPSAYLFDEESVARMTREWMAVLDRDYNHPSIIVWVPINESWGVPNVGDPSQQAHLKAMYFLTKSLDSTRLVIDNDGWEHTNFTDLFAIHDYTRTGQEFSRRFKDIAKNIPPPLYGKLYLAPGYTYNGSPIFLSEFGGIGYVPPSNTGDVPHNSWGYSGLEPTKDSALKRMRGLYSAIAKIPAITGICYTQLTDVEQEVNGLLTYDRHPKFDLESIQKINALL